MICDPSIVRIPLIYSRAAFKVKGLRRPTRLCNKKSRTYGTSDRTLKSVRPICEAVGGRSVRPWEAVLGLPRPPMASQIGLPRPHRSASHGLPRPPTASQIGLPRPPTASQIFWLAQTDHMTNCVRPKKKTLTEKKPKGPILNKTMIKWEAMWEAMWEAT